MTGEQSRALSIGDRVCWQMDQADKGTVSAKHWTGITVRWDNRSEQTILHNDMRQLERTSAD
jgi:hypothetical protein